MQRLLVLLLCSFFLSKTFAGELTAAKYWEGFQDGFSYLGQGAVEQFKEKNNLYVAAAAVPSLWWSFEEDKRITANARTKKIPKYMQISSDISPALGFPVIPIAFFSYGVKADDDRAVLFAKEYFGAMYLAFIESAALSYIQIHERPNTANLSKWETDFRGDSSFPSGHVIPYAVLALKTLQFYGPVPALLPTAIFFATSIQRVRDEKHYLSDVVGGFFLSVFASEGVRKVGNYQNNHQFYKKLFEHEASVGVTSFRGVVGPRLSWTY